MLALQSTLSAATPDIAVNRKASKLELELAGFSTMWVKEEVEFHGTEPVASSTRSIEIATALEPR
jgi:hypothetical protein